MNNDSMINSVMNYAGITSELYKLRSKHNKGVCPMDRQCNSCLYLMMDGRLGKEILLTIAEVLIEKACLK